MGEQAAGTLGQLAHLVGGAARSVVSFAVVLAGLCAGLATAVVGLGLPILAGTLAVGRWFAGVERRSVEVTTGRVLPAHHHRENTGTTRPRRIVRALADPQSWWDAAHAVLGFPLLLAAGLLAGCWALLGVGLTLYVTWEWALPRDGDYRGLLDLVTGIDGRGADIVTDTVIGIVLLVTLPLVVRGLTALRAGLARVLLTDRSADLRARADASEAGRRSAIAAEAQTLRRVERDLHDGPQQRLVRMSMDLEAVRRRLDDDPEQARLLLDEALAQSTETLAELRSLTRGIAPPVLVDRGLVAAVTAAAARCPVPTTVEVDPEPGGRPAPEVENAAYFVVTEALTNVAKHAGADRCTVRLATDAEEVFVQVDDDGRGGAHVGKGHGLAGLTDRVAALEGVLEIRSPAGGGTAVVARIPAAVRERGSR